MNNYFSKDGYAKMAIASKSFGAHEVLIDAEDIEKIQWLQWRLLKPFEHLYVVSGKNDVKRIYLHRLILSAPDDMEVDHINGNPLDNRKENLRLATRAQNNQNRKMHKRNAVGFKGVVAARKPGRFIGYIHTKEKKVHLGTFGSAEDAARAYNTAATEEYGEFAKLNTIKENA